MFKKHTSYKYLKHCLKAWLHIRSIKHKQALKLKLVQKHKISSRIKNKTEAEQSNYKQALQWHELPFHEFIKFLNWLNDVSFLKWSGSSFQVLAAKYLNEFRPYLVVLT